MIRTCALVVAAGLVVACSADGATTTPDDSPPAPSNPPAAPGDVETAAPTPTTADLSLTTPPGPTTTVPPFEPVPTTPTADGADLDDVLREERERATTTLPPTSPTQLAPLDPGPLGWTLRHAPSAESRTVHLLVDEGGCDGDVLPSERLEVTVEEDEREIRIGVSRISAATPERAPCPTAPWSPISAALAAPVAGREVISTTGQAIPPPDVGVEQLSLRTTVDAVPPPVATVTTFEDRDVRVLLDCTPVGTTVGREWRPTTTYASPDLVFAEAVRSLDRVADTWHLLVVDDGDARGPRSVWIVTVDGGAIARIEATPAVTGWTGAAAACARGDAVTEDATVDPSRVIAVGDERPLVAAEFLDLASAVGAETLPAGITIDGEGLRFTDPAARCAAWVAWEDALLAAGVTLGAERVVIDPATIPAPGPGLVSEVPRQTSRLLVAADGRTAVVTTTADGRITGAPTWSAAPSSSRLSPCRLDGETGLLRLVVV